MSDNTAYRPVFASEINPIAIPETGLIICTPASIMAMVPLQTVAIDDDPFDSNTSETTRTVYGKSSGIILFNARCAKFPCPTSLLEVPRIGLASPVEKGGKL